MTTKMSLQCGRERGDVLTNEAKLAAYPHIGGKSLILPNIKINNFDSTLHKNKPR